ncbi:hypothetical protein QWY75_02380 [Pontixanthobacter aestiaquae]|uniref:Uncharacterized protein n=1 Tax=Pontixanthobacter aestiaquae TaxID=1509367 RepID=A0A844ZAQ1_9SPHN|nr:hypothetical protein [Pontixanthobacter aestiaquae]MDN3645050.1 hypothetical protein [Pontixanthobacter aestiaquae]MXO83950.1 hypothetical protein [Pontixanthobacter aestiaquae]
MRQIFLVTAAAAAIATQQMPAEQLSEQPAAQSIGEATSEPSEKFEDAVERIGKLFEDGFDELSGDDRVTRDLFLEAATSAETVLAEHPDLDEESKRDMHLKAANGYYYAAEKEHWMAPGASDDGALSTATIDYLLKALEHQKIVFAEGQNDLLVAEYLFGTTMLVEHGMTTGDPRTEEWSIANVHAGRLRIDESKMFDRDTHYGAMSDLAVTLIDHAKITGNAEARQEADKLIAEIPADERSFDLRDRLR